MFDIPKILPYPTISNIDECPMIIGKFCYVIYDYKPEIVAVIKRKDGNVGAAIGDWNGNSILPGHALWDRAQKFLSDDNVKIVQVMAHININQAEFFISDIGLVDVQISANKFIGPGMLRDIFENIMPIQKVAEINTITIEKINSLKAQNIGYIIKPSRFQTINDTPMYARV